jgi:type I restriction enzyme S subunit
MEKWPLPEGWRWQTLGKVVVDTERIDPRERPDEPFTYIEISSVDSETGRIVDPRQMLGKEAPSRARRLVRKNDVIFATTRPYLRNIALIPPEYDNEVCTTGFCVLRANHQQVMSKWLLYVTRSNVVMHQIEPLMHGASYPAVTNSETLSVEIPVPPLEIQRRIVARIEGLFAELGAARHLHAALVHDAERLMDAVLADLFPFSDDLSVNEWAVYELNEESCCEIVAGQHILSKNYSNEKTGSPYLTGPADFGNKYPIVSKWTESPKVFCVPGDVLLTVKGAGVGKVNCAPQDGRTCIGRQIMALRPNTKKLNGDFLYYFLQSRFELFQTMGRSATVPGINKGQVSQVKVPIPPLETQRRLVAYLDEVQAHAAELQHTAEAVAADLDRLEQSILAQAFRGTL